MNIEDIPRGLCHEYNQICDFCGMTTTILTQRDNQPEYEAEVYVQCQCGNYIEFNLPVN